MLNIMFLELPAATRAVLKINGSAALVNTWYDVSDEIKIEKTAIDNYGEPLGFIKYKVKNGADIESNIATITINALPDKSVVISGETASKPISSTPSTFKDIATLSDSCDRIKIHSYTGYGVCLFNNSPIYPGQIIMKYDFDKITFQTNPYELYVTTNYSQFNYYAGNIDEIDETLYTLTFSRSGTSEIDIQNETEDELEDRFVVYKEIILKNINPEEEYNFSLTVTENEGTISGLSESTISLILPEEEIVLLDDSSVPFVLKDLNNKVLFRAEIYKNEFPLDIDFLLTLTANDGADAVSFNISYGL